MHYHPLNLRVIEIDMARACIQDKLHDIIYIALHPVGRKIE